MDISILMNHANSCIPRVFVCVRLLPPSTSDCILQIATTFWMFHLPQHSNQELDQERCFTSGCNSGAMRACGNWRRNGGDGGDRALTPKIILSQEKNIQKLNEIVQSLREELLHCRGGSEVVNSTATHLTELLTELERHPILED
nr:uncharacterized protein LOC112019337 [Quercus suber]